MATQEPLEGQGPSSSPRVLVADDHAVFCEGLVRLLESRFHIVGTVNDGTLLLEAASRLHPDVILLDLSMPKLGGFEALRQMELHGVDARVIVLTMHADPMMASEAVKLGASGFVSKQCGGSELVEAIETTLRGGVYLSSSLTDRSPSASKQDAEADVPLTAEQVEVLKLLAAGQRIKDIANTLGLPRRRIETMKYEISHRLNLRSTAEIVRYAVQNGLISGAVENVFVVDEDDDGRTGMCRTLAAAGFSVQGFASAESFLTRPRINGAGCLVVDQHLPGLSGLELQRTVAGDGMMSVVFVTTHGDVSSAVQAMKSGAVDFLAKPVRADELIAAVRRGLTRSARSDAERQLRDGFIERVARLTPREREVASCVIQGMLNKQIAWELGTAEKTVKVHRGRAMEKLEVGSVAELVRLAERTGALTLAQGGSPSARPITHRHPRA